MKCNFKFAMPKSDIVRCQLKLENIQVNECDESDCILQRILSNLMEVVRIVHKE